MIDVSIIIAAWNAAAFLERSIGCALAQKGVSLEVIVCDDASTDHTSELVCALADARVVYLRAATNSGPAAARNMGLSIASGDWILVLDADDEMAPSRARRLIEIGRSEQAHIVSDNLRIRDVASGQERLHISEKLDDGREAIDLSFYINANLIFGSMPAYGYLKPLFRKDFLRAHGLLYPEFMRVGEDFALVCEILARGGRFVRSRSADYIYKTHSGSISHRLKRRDLASMMDFDRTFSAEHAGELAPAEMRALERHLAYLRTADAFTAMLDGLKEKRFGDVFATAAARPQALRLFSMPLHARLGRLRAALSR